MNKVWCSYIIRYFQEVNINELLLHNRMGESQRYNIKKKKSSIKGYVVQRQAKLI